MDWSIGSDRMQGYLVFSGGQIVINLRLGSRRYNECRGWWDALSRGGVRSADW